MQSQKHRPIYTRPFEKGGHRLKLVLVGNPNVGKSVFFNALTDSYADVSNFPGTTVELLSGEFGLFTVTDTPGVYSLSDYNDEERVTLSAVQDCDLILNIVDATHLDRDLFLTQQLIDCGKPVIAVFNMMDALEKYRMTADLAGFSDALGIPVLPASALNETGISAIMATLLASGEQMLKNPGQRPPRSLMGNQTPGNRPGEDSPELWQLRRDRTDQLLQLYFRVIKRKPTRGEALGTAMLSPFPGIPLLLLLLAAILYFIGVVVAQNIVGFTEKTVMGTWYYNLVLHIAQPVLDPDSFFGSLLIGEYGVFTMVPIYLFGLLLPLVIGFYLMMSLLEDSGLLPRVAVLLDRIFTAFGLNGRGVIPMILGFGCVTMALITTRILGSRRERLIASVLLCIAVPCSAQFAIILGIASSLSPGYLMLYAAIVLSVFLLLGTAMNRLLPGTSTELFIDIPPMRLPSGQNIIKKTARKTKHFLLDAGPMFVLGAVIITLLAESGGFALLRQWCAPITEGLLHLPPEATNVFIMCIIKRDLGAAGLYSLVESSLLTAPQIVVALTVITFFVPCFASMLILCKEQRVTTALLIWLGSILTAFTVGGLTAALL